MHRSGAPRRLNRLPQRLDYTLIPAPLDLTLPLVDEKASLPAIIVTPSSPIGEKDFAIAFLALPPKPSFFERLKSRLSSFTALPLQVRLPSQIQLPQTPLQKEFADQASAWSVKTKARTAIVFAILLFIVACHLIMHSMVAGHPHMEFGLGHDNDMIALSNLVAPHPRSSDIPESDVLASAVTSTPGGWFNLDAIWAPVPNTEGKRSARFVISEEGNAAESK